MDLIDTPISDIEYFTPPDVLGWLDDEDELEMKEETPPEPPVPQTPSETQNQSVNAEVVNLLQQPVEKENLQAFLENYLKDGRQSLAKEGAGFKKTPTPTETLYADASHYANTMSDAYPPPYEIAQVDMGELARNLGIDSSDVPLSPETVVRLEEEKRKIKFEQARNANVIDTNYSWFHAKKNELKKLERWDLKVLPKLSNYGLKQDGNPVILGGITTYKGKSFTSKDLVNIVGPLLNPEDSKLKNLIEVERKQISYMYYNTFSRVFNTIQDEKKIPSSNDEAVLFLSQDALKIGTGVFGAYRNIKTGEPIGFVVYQIEGMAVKMEGKVPRIKVKLTPVTDFATALTIPGFPQFLEAYMDNSWSVQYEMPLKGMNKK